MSNYPIKGPWGMCVESYGAEEILSSCISIRPEPTTYR